jgi:hypothetical protein
MIGVWDGVAHLLALAVGVSAGLRSVRMASRRVGLAAVSPLPGL